MMRSLSSAVSGLKAHQEWIDVIGDNIANINTSGFKKSRVSFEDMLYQTMQSASRPSTTIGGTNPMQIGPGVSVSSIDTIMSGNTLQSTDKNTDLGIDGDGFFCLANGNQDYYTRTGNFSFDSNGTLASANGMKVQGWTATGGVLPDPNNTKPGDIVVPILGATTNANATTKSSLAGNLSSTTDGTVSPLVSTFAVSDTAGHDASLTLTLTPSNAFNTWNYSITSTNGTVTNGTGTITVDNAGKVTAATGSTTVVVGTDTYTVSPPALTTTIDHFTAAGPAGVAITDPSVSFTAASSTSVPQTVYDSKGDPYTVTTTFTRTGNNTWGWQSNITNSSGGTITPSPGTGSGTVTFDATGHFQSAAGDTTISFDPGNGANLVAITPDFSTMTQNAADTSALAQSQDGYTAGALSSITFDTSGTINGVYSNGVSQALAQVALTNFANPSGLQKEGDTMFSESNNSGAPQTGYAGKSGYGSIKPGSLEASNVDLSTEFTDMITAQRGFEANSKVITTSDTMLSDLVSMIR
ncbi:MAG: flagellar hook protein FlgE [Thermacetogeniaceae bacterium]